MPLVARILLDGAPAPGPGASLALPPATAGAVWLTQAHFMAALARGSTSEADGRALAVTLPWAVVALSAGGSALGAHVAAGEAGLTITAPAGPAGPASTTRLGPHGTGRAPPGSTLALVGGRWTLRMDRLEREAWAAEQAAAAAAASAAAPPPPPPPPPPQRRTHTPPGHVKVVRAVTAAHKPGGPLSALRVALLNPAHGQRAAEFAAGLGASIAWLADTDPLDAWPASQAGMVGGSGSGAGAPLFTHIVVDGVLAGRDYFSSFNKARLRAAGLLPPPPPGRVGEAWAPPPGAPPVLPLSWLTDCNKARAVVDAAPASAAFIASVLQAEADAIAARTVAAAQAAAAARKRAADAVAKEEAKRGKRGHATAAAKAATAAAQGGGGGGTGKVPAAPVPIEPVWPPKGDGGCGGEEPSGGDAAAAFTPPSPPALPPTQPVAPEDACAMVAAAARAYAAHPDATRAPITVPASATPAPPPRFKWTGGESGVTWGAGDVWVEPFDPPAMKRTLDALYKWWAPWRSKVKAKAAAAAAAAAATVAATASGGGGGGGGGGGPSPGGADEAQTDDEGSDDEEGGPAADTAASPPGRRINNVCAHPACGLRPYCIVDTLAQAEAALYTRTGADFHKGRALRQGITAVASAPRPLNTRADVEALTRANTPGGSLGPQTIAKIWEVLATGHLERLTAALADPAVVARKALAKVWGVGETTAARWVGAGIMSVDDLRAEAALPGGGRVGGLTVTQALGLKHHADFSARIPAAEVQAVLAAARAAAFAELGCDDDGYPLSPGGGGGGGARDPAAAPAHVRACGSWLRANAAADIPAAAAGLAAARQATYGDVDLLISPPPLLTTATVASPGRAWEPSVGGAPAPGTGDRHGERTDSDDDRGQKPGRPKRTTSRGTSTAGAASAQEAMDQAVLMETTRAATEANHSLLKAVLEGLQARGFGVEAANAAAWYAPTPRRLGRKVDRATLADEGEGAPLLSPPPTGGRGGTGGGAGEAAGPAGAPGSWMGAVRLPAGHPALGGSPPRWRRLDVKVYSRPSLPTAVAYFTGDSSFNRALRYWAKASTTARGSARAWCAQQEPGCHGARAATGWHLSDTHMFPIDLSTDKNATRKPVGPSALLTCESDLFEMLGLAYVPPFARTFTAHKPKVGSGGGGGGGDGYVPPK